MKYIIDVPTDSGWIEIYSPINGESNHFKGTVIGIDQMEIYTEPDRQVIENEVWNLAKTCCDIMDYEWQLDTYQQAKSKIEEWKKSNDKTRFGDEVIPKNKDGHGEKGVILSMYQPKQYKPLADVLWCDGTVDKMVVVEKLVRTGRHFDHVERLLEGMRNE